MQVQKISKTFIAISIVAILAVAVTAAVMVGAPKSHAASSHTKPSLFALEHQHGKVSKVAISSTQFSYTCPGAVNGNLVINVTEKVANDADSGQAGNYWGLDAFTRTIKVWNTGSDSYCAIVSYTGTFAAQGGQASPGTTASTGGTLTGDEIGSMKGSAQLFITGPLDVSNPSTWPLLGKVNGGTTVDYQCVIAQDGSANCPGYVDWTQQYFDQSSASYTLSEPNWGWKYVGKDAPTAPDAGRPDGVWVNASTGNSGDILDVD